MGERKGAVDQLLFTMSRRQASLQLYKIPQGPLEDGVGRMQTGYIDLQVHDGINLENFAV